MPTTGFTWPPKSPAPPAPVGETAPVAQQVPQSRHDYAASHAPTRSEPSVLRSVERVWFGLKTPPFSERAAAAGWTSDEPHHYCPRCGHNVGPHEADDTGCSRCRGRKFPWQRLVRLGEYSGLLRNAIQEVKFTRWRRLGHELGLLLGRSLSAAIDDAGLPRERCVLVPVPCSFRRRMARGIDHTLVLSRGVASATGLPIARALSRSHRPTQLSLPASERTANVAGSIRPRRGVDLAERVVMLIDDVTTTRATLLAASRAVTEAHKVFPDKQIRTSPALWTAVLGVTPRPDEGSPRDPRV